MTVCVVASFCVWHQRSDAAHAHASTRLVAARPRLIVCDTAYSRVIQASYRAAKDTQPKPEINDAVYEPQREGLPIGERTPLACARLIAGGRLRRRRALHT